MDAPYRRSAGGSSIESSPARARAERRSRLIKVAIAVATIALASVVLGAEPGFAGCSVGVAPIQR